MILLLEFTIKISMVVALGLLAASLLRRQSAALRHWLLASAIALALGTPLLIGVAPSWTLPVTDHAIAGQSDEAQRATTKTPRIGITTTIQNQPATTIPTERRVAPAVVLLTMWIAGVAVNLAGLLFGSLTDRGASSSNVTPASQRPNPWGRRLTTPKFGTSGNP